MRSEDLDILHDISATAIGRLLRGWETAPLVAETSSEIESTLRHAEEGDWLRVLAYRNSHPFCELGTFLEIEGEVVNNYLTAELANHPRIVMIDPIRGTEWRENQRQRDLSPPIPVDDPSICVGIKYNFSDMKELRYDSDEVYYTAEGGAGSLGCVIRAELTTSVNATKMTNTDEINTTT